MTASTQSAQAPAFQDVMGVTNRIEESVAAGDLANAKKMAMGLMQSGKTMRTKAILIQSNPLPIAEKLVEVLTSSALKMEPGLKFTIAKTARLFIELTCLKASAEKWVGASRVKSELIAKIQEMVKPLKKKENEEIALRHELDCAKAKLKLMKSDESTWGNYIVTLLKVALDGDFGSGIEQVQQLGSKLNKSSLWIGQVHFIYFTGMECIESLQMLKQLQSYMRPHLQEKQIALCAVNVFADLVENGTPEIQTEALLGEPGLLSLSKTHATNPLNTLWAVRYLALQHLIVFTSHPNPSIRENALQRLDMLIEERNNHVNILLSNYKLKPELKEQLKQFFRANAQEIQEQIAKERNELQRQEEAVQPTRNRDLADLLTQLLENPAIEKQPELFAFLGNKYDLLISQNMAGSLDEMSVALYNQLTWLLRANNQVNQFVANKLIGQRANAPQTPSDSNNNNAAVSNVEQKSTAPEAPPIVTLSEKLPLLQLMSKANEGDAEAQFNLGLCYGTGDEVPKDAVQAAYWYRKAAEQGHARSQFLLGLCCQRGHGVPKDAVQAAYWYRKAAEQGDAYAQTNLGLCYQSEHGVPKDDVQAISLYRKAAEQGHAPAYVCLAVCYQRGAGVTKDAVQAISLYRKAADQGDAEGQINLGCCYEEGDGVTKDAVQAAYWYKKAAEQGHVYAQFCLGCCYEEGRGVIKDAVQATHWYRKAAKQGKALAQTKLGLCYEQGCGVPKDDVQAVHWYRKAAEQGSPRSQIHLGLCYEQGRGVPKDAAQALFWYRKATGQ